MEREISQSRSRQDGVVAYGGSELVNRGKAESDRDKGLKDIKRDVIKDGFFYNHPVLTYEQERRVFRAYRQNESVGSLFGDPVFRGSWSVEDVEKFDRLSLACKTPADVFHAVNMRLVRMIAKRVFVNSRLSWFERNAEGHIGINSALKNWNPDQGTKFSTYSVLHIVRAIEKEAYKLRFPEITELMHRSLLFTKKLESIFLEKFGRRPMADEMRRQLLVNAPKMTLAMIDKVIEYREQGLFLISGSKKIGRSEVELQDTLVDEDRGPEEAVINGFMLSDLKKIILKLSDREKRLIGMLFGLNGQRTMSLGEVSEMMSMSYGEAYEMKEAVLKKIGSELGSGELEPDMGCEKQEDGDSFFNKVKNLLLEGNKIADIAKLMKEPVWKIEVGRIYLFSRGLVESRRLNGEKIREVFEKIKIMRNQKNSLQVIADALDMSTERVRQYSYILELSGEIGKKLSRQEKELVVIRLYENGVKLSDMDSQSGFSRHDITNLLKGLREEGKIVPRRLMKDERKKMAMNARSYETDIVGRELDKNPVVLWKDKMKNLLFD